MSPAGVALRSVSALVDPATVPEGIISPPSMHEIAVRSLRRVSQANSPLVAPGQQRSCRGLPRAPHAAYRPASSPSSPPHDRSGPTTIRTARKRSSTEQRIDVNLHMTPSHRGRGVQKRRDRSGLTPLRMGSTTFSTAVEVSSASSDASADWAWAALWASRSAAVSRTSDYGSESGSIPAAVHMRSKCSPSTERRNSMQRLICPWTARASSSSTLSLPSP